MIVNNMEMKSIQFPLLCFSYSWYYVTDPNEVVLETSKKKSSIIFYIHFLIEFPLLND